MYKSEVQFKHKSVNDAKKAAKSLVSKIAARTEKRKVGKIAFKCAILFSLFFWLIF